MKQSQLDKAIAGFVAERLALVQRFEAEHDVLDKVIARLQAQHASATSKRAAKPAKAKPKPRPVEERAS